MDLHNLLRDEDENSDTEKKGGARSHVFKSHQALTGVHHNEKNHRFRMGCGHNNLVSNNVVVCNVKM